MKSDNTKSEGFNLKNLYRSTDNKVIAGICGGLGEHFEVDPIIIRIIFILLFVYGGSGLLFYIILWIIIPKKRQTIKDNVEEIRAKANEMIDKIRGVRREKRHGLFGILLVVFGIMFLLDNLGIAMFDQVWRFWPLILIFFGISIISRNK